MGGQDWKLSIIIGNGSIKGWFCDWRTGWDRRFCKQAIGLVLFARFHYIIHCFCRRTVARIALRYARGQILYDAFSGRDKALETPCPLADQSYLFASDTSKVSWSLFLTLRTLHFHFAIGRTCVVLRRNTLLPPYIEHIDIKQVFFDIGLPVLQQKHSNVIGRKRISWTWNERLRRERNTFLVTLRQFSMNFWYVRKRINK